MSDVGIKSSGDEVDEIDMSSLSTSTSVTSVNFLQRITTERLVWRKWIEQLTRKCCWSGDLDVANFVDKE